MNSRLSSDAHASSIMELRVYARHKIRRDNCIGVVKGTIASLLAEGANGSEFFLIHPLTEYKLNFITLAVTRQLCNSESTKGNHHDIRTIIEFAITSLATLSGAAQAQMDEAVTQGNEAIETPVASPQVAGMNVGAVTAGVVSSMGVGLESLLEKIKLVTEIVDRLSEVLRTTETSANNLTHMFTQIHPYANMAWSILSAAYKVCMFSVDCCPWLMSNVPRLSWRRRTATRT